MFDDGHFSEIAGHHPQHDTLVVVPRFLGLGKDMIIGGPSGPPIRVIDLSRLDESVIIDWSADGCGTISDGADTILFYGVSEIILPPCMREPVLGASIA